MHYSTAVIKLNESNFPSAQVTEKGKKFLAELLRQLLEEIKTLLVK